MFHAEQGRESAAATGFRVQSPVASTAWTAHRAWHAQMAFHNTRAFRLAGNAIAAAAGLIFSGCALHYYDKRSGTEHVWGIGHVRMKAAPVAENIDSVISGTSIAGVSLGAGRHDYYVTAGWDFRRRIVVGTNAALSLEWPTADFYNVRVGAEPPFLTPGFQYSVQSNQWIYE